MNLLRKFSLAILITVTTAFNSYGMLATIKAVASKANSDLFAPIYKAESIRTSAIRTVMAAACLADGYCSCNDAMMVALAAASTFTATAYDANGTQRCAWLPSSLNFVADGIATIASFDAGCLPITGTEVETLIRSTIGNLSLLATGLTFLL